MKRFISTVLVIITVLTLLPLTAFAESGNMRASDDIINVIKKFEGFSATAYRNGPNETYLTIGYGHHSSDVTEDMEISEADAVELLRKDVARFEGSVNGFFKKHHLNYSQQVFDAVLSLSFNIGTEWMNDSSYRIRSYLINGVEKYDELEVANALGVISVVNASAYPGLIKRRIREAQIMLYGDYSGMNSPDYTYLILNADGGEFANGKRVAIYAKEMPYGSLPGAYKKGFVHKGWKTKDGTVISASDIATEPLEVKAIWEEGEPETYSLTVTGGAGSGFYAEGETVSIIPGNASAGEFLAWRSGGINIVTENGGYVFRMPAYDLSITGLRDYNCTGKICPSAGFKDVGPYFWAHDAIDFVYANDLFRGFTDTVFKPNMTMSRGMLITVLYRLNGSPDVSGYDNPFSDVKEDSPYHDAILWGYRNRIAVGYVGGLFSPNTALKREHLAVFLFRYANLMGYDTSICGKLDDFTDAELVSEYAAEAMGWAFGNGIINGTSAHTLGAQDSATRAQVSMMITRFVRNVVSGAIVKEIT